MEPAGRLAEHAEAAPPHDGHDAAAELETALQQLETRCSSEACRPSPGRRICVGVAAAGCGSSSGMSDTAGRQLAASSKRAAAVAHAADRTTLATPGRRCTTTNSGDQCGTRRRSWRCAGQDAFASITTTTTTTTTTTLPPPPKDDHHDHDKHHGKDKGGKGGEG
jgi:hypothetical protein